MVGSEPERQTVPYLAGDERARTASGGTAVPGGAAGAVPVVSRCRGCSGMWWEMEPGRAEQHRGGSRGTGEVRTAHTRQQDPPCAVKDTSPRFPGSGRMRILAANTGSVAVHPIGTGRHPSSRAVYGNFGRQ